MSEAGFQIPDGALDVNHSIAARDPVHETIRECAGCGQTVVVCGYVYELPDPYLCLDCRPFVDERAVTLKDTIAKARQAQRL